VCLLTSSLVEALVALPGRQSAIHNVMVEESFDQVPAGQFDQSTVRTILVVVVHVR